jgi:hypothetical protein
MDSVPIWAIWSTIPGVVVLAPVLSVLLAVATVTVIGLLREMGMPAVLAMAASVGVGLLIRKQQVRSRNPGSAMTAPEIGSPARVAKSVADNVMPFPASASRHGGGAARRMIIAAQSGDCEFARSPRASGTRRPQTAWLFCVRGTKSSNPAPSSGESANFRSLSAGRYPSSS